MRRSKRFEVDRRDRPTPARSAENSSRRMLSAHAHHRCQREPHAPCSSISMAWSIGVLYPFLGCPTHLRIGSRLATKSYT